MPCPLELLYISTNTVSYFFVKKINWFLIDDNEILLQSNSFTENIASNNGLAIYIAEGTQNATIYFKNNDFLKNSIDQRINQSSGSVIFLVNPGVIFFIDTYFRQNIGIFGTCIFYSEISTQ